MIAVENNTKAMTGEMESQLEVSWNIGNAEGEETVLKRTRSRSLTESQQLPSVTENGIRLGTPVAREAARSFWSMDMLKTSLNRMAFYADYENHSQGSLGSADSGFQSRVSSARSTPKLPQIVSTSTPSSPLTITRHVHADDDDDDDDAGLFLGTPALQPPEASPLLIARKKREKGAAAEPSTSTLLSTSSLSPASSSKTISPSASSQLFPSKAHTTLGRCRSVEPPSSRQLLLPHRRLRVAHSYPSVYHYKPSNSELQHPRTLTFLQNL